MTGSCGKQKTSAKPQIPTTSRMASGYGYHGGAQPSRSRCHNFWQEFNKCYAMADSPQECLQQRDDYLECLHHTKEIARVSRIKAEELKQTEQRKREEAAAKKAADSAAKSNVARLGIVAEDKEAATAKA
ncbi:hypothetical protein BC937DRAFT_87553 [Endogone sp. FLAS-F59071]|nr:hypothetical protein BC937DRAFT_87553 [Endogone sp. FLAS-F59071]|eukprot:RUS19400.1 hypothetical protein BC937DRAFT_87553 [Endogone sp. FLAS-F59071]